LYIVLIAIGRNNAPLAWRVTVQTTIAALRGF